MHGVFIGVTDRAATITLKDMATRYAHVNIIAADWKLLCDFYQEVFDCEPASTSRTDRQRWLVCGYVQTA